MLTNERLKKLSEMRITELIDNITFGDLKEIVSELLAIREAGDEEVDKLESRCFDGADHTSVSSEAVHDLANLAIARGQTRTDAVNKAVEWAKECKGLQEQLREAREEIERLRVSSFAAPEGTTIQSLQSQITTLTAERDEARKDLEKQIDITYEAKAVVSQMQKDKHDNDGLANQRFTDDKEKIDLLTSELAALKSAPGMEDVDALSGDFTAEECDQPCLTTWMQRNKKLADLARRSIAAREEVVGLLKRLKEKVLPLLPESLEEMADEPDDEFYKDARRILEIVEGK